MAADFARTRFVRLAISSQIRIVSHRLHADLRNVFAIFARRSHVVRFPRSGRRLVRASATWRTRRVCTGRTWLSSGIPMAAAADQ